MSGSSTGPTAADETPDERRNRETLASGSLLLHRNPQRRTGDFWPGNTLWNDGKLVAVIDRKMPRFRRPARRPLPGSRLEVLWAFGADAMHAFTLAYLAMNPLGRHRPAVLIQKASCAVSILPSCLDAATEQRFRAGLGPFIDQAFEKLAVRPPC